MKLGMIRGQSEPLHGERPSLRTAGQKLMLKGSSPTAPIVHKRSALDIPSVEMPTTVPTITVKPKTQRVARPPKTARPVTEYLPNTSKDLTKFETAYLELEAKSLIEISGELFPDDPLAVRLPAEVYKASLPARLVYEIKPRDAAAFKDVPALDYSFDTSSKPGKTPEPSFRSPRRDLPNLLTFDPSAVSKLNVQAVSEARSSVLVRTADTLLRARKQGTATERNWSQQPRREARGPTPFEIAMGLRREDN